MSKHDQPGEFGRTAFDHPLVKCQGSPIALNGERVLVPKDCGCPKCVERLARYKTEGLVAVK
jgi:hypothetical protein